MSKEQKQSFTSKHIQFSSDEINYIDSLRQTSSDTFTGLLRQVIREHRIKQETHSDIKAEIQAMLKAESNITIESISLLMADDKDMQDKQFKGLKSIYTTLNKIAEFLNKQSQ